MSMTYPYGGYQPYCKCGQCPLHYYTTTTGNTTFTWLATEYQPKHRKPGPAQ